jgi:hypothetical protein
MTLRLLAGSALLLGGAALAQNPLPLQGFTYNWDRPAVGNGVSLYIRFNGVNEEMLSRIDRDDHKDWGLDSNGLIAIQGYVTYILDVTDQTRENYSIVGYAEDPARPNFPNTATRILNVGPIPMPPTGAVPGQVAYRVAATFTTPVTFANGGDVFLGVNVPPAVVVGTSVTDGLFVGSADNDNTAAGSGVFDLPGPTGQLGGSIAQQSYLCYNPLTGTPLGPLYVPANATSLEQLAFDPFLSGTTVGGVALTSTNQTSYTSSNTPPGGTSDFLSGLHPDLNGSNPGRADNVGFAVTTGVGQVAAGNPAFVLLALGPSPVGSLPLTTLLGSNAGPGSAGNVCVDFTTAASFLTILAVGQPNSFTVVAEGQVNVPISAGLRSALTVLPGPIDLWWQAIVIDTSGTGPGLEIRSSGCVLQHLK